MKPCVEKGRIILGPEVWKRVFTSPSYKQTMTLFKKLFKRPFGYFDPGVSQEELARLQKLFLAQGPFTFPPFCKLIYNTDEGKKRCREDNRVCYTRMVSTCKIDISTCYAGLTEIGIPITFRGKYCGCLSTVGGLLLHPPNQAEWEKIAAAVRDLGVDLARLKKAYFEITPVSGELFDVMIQLLNVMVEGIIKAAVETEEDKKRIAELEGALYQKYRFANIIGQSKPMMELFQLLENVKETESPVLIQGETGTGKELVARAIHYNSPRKDKAFCPQNCAAVAESLLEAELFGHTKGAFTGALRDHRGLFELADGGTVFLDEIAEMSPQMQAKILRVIEQGEFKRVGGEKISKADVRIIAATNQDLKSLIKEGRFRQDLYYRIKVIQIDLPPLKDRGEDIPLLVNHFLKKYSLKSGKKLELHTDALKLLCDYHWPGNVRELENELQRAVTLAKHTITPEVLSKEIQKAVNISESEDIRTRFQGKSLKEAGAEVEKELLLGTLEKTNWNKAAAASLLSIPRITLHNKIQKYGLKKTPK